MKLWFFLLDICYYFRYIFVEAPRGLDFFRMRDPYAETSDSLRYQTKSYRKIAKIFDGYVRPDSYLLDVGCGKGHVLYCAQKMGCRYTDGIELDAGLAAIARQNIRRLALPDATVTQCDARDFDLLDKYDVIYLFNPFGKNTMEAFLHHVEASLRRRPRELTVIYANPDQRALWDASPFFDLAETRMIPQVLYDIHIFYYRHTRSFHDYLRGAAR